MFNDTLPHKYKSPLEQGDHPELDFTGKCNDEDIQDYQTMIGTLQWLLSLGRFDIFSAVVTLSRFRIDPRVGHLERLKRVYGYVRKF